MKRRYVFCTCIVLICIYMISDIIYSVYQSGILSFENYFIQHNARESIKEDKLSSYIQQQVEKQNIPGLAAAYIHGDNEEIICSGYSDLKNNNKVKVSTSTLLH